jgi:predicted metalloprotease with PDZ domain
MKKIFFVLIIAAFLWSCKSTKSLNSSKNSISVEIDLNNTKNDKVMVTVSVPKISTSEITYHIPKIVPGTYSEDNYGKFIENLKALDTNGKELTVKKSDDNSWIISNAKTLNKITYLVNDTYDIESTHEIFSPAGTNISSENYMINTHGFVGYFTEKEAVSYKITILHPSKLWGATSMIDTDSSDTKDVFVTSRYAELVENPIMYSKPNYTNFNVNGMDILISVYSPNGKITAQSITPKMKTVMTAQKNFLGKFNSTKKYSVLIYLSDLKKADAKGFGALEHPTATTVVMPEMMEIDQLIEQLKDIVSHEFFHIVTPLTIHSKEIQDFDYNTPKMSQHLWMYEGVTEYFANLFQINQGLITEENFYTRMSEKIDHANNMNDTMSFTKMSANVLVNPYKNQYLNVYEKGALIAMCIDIQIRESSKGKRGILDLMQKLSSEYGIKKAFNDNDLFAKINKLTYPEVGEFLKTYVSGETPIPYEKYFAKVGLTRSISKLPENVFVKGREPFVDVNKETKEILIRQNIELPIFYKTLGIKNGDIITSVNNKKYNLDNIYDLISESQKWKENDLISLKVKREGKTIDLKGKVKLSFQESNNYQATDVSKKSLKEAWLKG